MAPAPTRTSRSRWLEEGLRMLGAAGPDAVRIERLASALGVTKGGFYGLFTGREQFLTELVDEWERRSVDDVIAEAERDGGDPQRRILRAGELTFSRELLPVDLAIRDWARRDPAVAKRLERVDDQRRAYLRTLFSQLVSDPDEIEGRITLAFALAIGQHFMATGDRRSRHRAFDRALAYLLRVG